jgi:alpha-mannosidase
MYHKQRWTPEKIKQRLELISPLVYIRRKSLPSFRYRELDDALTAAPIGMDVDDSAWQEIDAHEYWGSWMQNFVLRTTFLIPDGWDKAQPLALFLPLGEAGDFSHPEALAYIDGEAYAACDRHHQEILLRPEWADGRSHLLALHGWTGLGGATSGEALPNSICAVRGRADPPADARFHRPGARRAGDRQQSRSKQSRAHMGLLSALNDAFIALDTRDPLDSDHFYQRALNLPHRS